jgi:uncharacterized protein (DUF2164 family)
MKITRDELRELGFVSDAIGRIYYNDNWQYEFNVTNNQLIFYNDGFPEVEPLVIIKHLKQVMDSLNQY